MNDLTVVIPTFNESDNIERLINKINSVSMLKWFIIVIDDNSPDKTSLLVKNIQKNHSNVFLIKRKRKSGRGSAVIAGMKYAKKLKTDFILEMDADFSHNPKDIKKFIKKAITTNSDFVVGSRYSEGSKIFNWSIRRKVFSRLANLYARILLGVPISDYTNGFRLYRRSAVEYLLENKLKSKGYILLSETAYLLYKGKFKYNEIPIVFVNRKRGSSNLDLSEIINSFVGIWKIRFS